MIRQLGLFDHPPKAIEPSDKTVKPAAKQRLSKQCRTILQRLKNGPATNDELSLLARKYTGRLSDLRGAGCTITCFDQDHKTGLTHYRLDYCPETL